MFRMTAHSQPLIRAVVLAAFTIALSPASRAEAASLESTKCNFTNANIPARCFWLTVPENRTNPSAKTVKLFVAVLKSASSNPKPDPIVYLPGGPGQSASPAVDVFARFPTLADRDFILMDPRGTGRSQPNLACPEITKARTSFFTAKSRPRPFQEPLSQFQSASRQCGDRLRAANIDLGAYSTIALANDVADLRKALSISQWNVFSVSYGTRVALEVMR